MIPMNHLLKFDRFGEEVVDKVSEIKMNESNSTSDADVDLKLENLKKEFISETNKLLEKVKDLIERVNKQVDFEKDFINVKKKRIANVKRAIDRSDAVTKDQMDEVKEKVDGILKGFEVTSDCIKIKDGRKICGIGHSVDPFDAINGMELLSLTKRVAMIESKMGGSRATTIDI